MIALLFILGFEPFNFFLFPVIVLSLLFFIALKEQPSRTAYLFFSFGFFLFGVGLYWLYISISVISGAPSWLSFLLIAFLAAAMSTYYALAGYLISYSYKKFNSKMITLLFFAPSLWVTMEWIRGYLFTGFSMVYIRVQSNHYMVDRMGTYWWCLYDELYCCIIFIFNFINLSEN